MASDNHNYNRTETARKTFNDEAQPSFNEISFEARQAKLRETERLIEHTRQYLDTEDTL